MALSEANQIKVCQILQVTPSVLEYQLTLLGADFTAAVQSAVEAQITLWDAGAGTKTTRLHPTESNKGVETRPDAAKNDIRRNIAVLLDRVDWGGSGGATVQVFRG